MASAASVSWMIFSATESPASVVARKDSAHGARPETGLQCVRADPVRVAVVQGFHRRLRCSWDR